MTDSNPYSLENIQGESAPVENNPYSIKNIQQNQDVRANLGQAMDKNPDEAAKAYRIALESNTPVSAVQDNFKDVNRQAMIDRYAQSTQPFKATQNLLKDPDKAPFIHDDIQNMTDIEKALSFMSASGRAGLHDFAAAGAKLLDVAQPFTTSDQDLAVLYKNDPEGLKRQREQGASAVLSRFARNQTQDANDIMAKVPQQVKDTYSNLEYQTLDPEKAAYLHPVKVVSDAIRSLPTSAALALTAFLTRGASLKAEQASLATGASAEVAKQAGIDAAVHMASRFGAGSEGAVGFAQQYNSTQNQVEQTPFSNLSKTPLDQFKWEKPGDLVEGTLANSDSFKQLVDAGYDPNAARIFLSARTGEQAGLGAGLTDALTNAVGGHFLGKIIGEGGKLLPRMGKGSLTEGIQEFAQSGGEQLSENLALKNNINPEQDLSKGVVESMLQGLAVGGLTGGTFSGIAGRAQRDEDKAKRADEFRAAAEKLNKLAQANKVLGRDYDTFEGFAQQAGENGNLTHVYIDADALMQTGVAEQIAAVSPSVAEQLPLAAETKGTLSIPVGEYTAAIAPTEYAQALVPIIKEGPNEFSQQEAADFRQNFQEDLVKEMESTLASKETDDEFKQSTSSLKEKFQTELDALGHHTPDVNKAYSTLLGDFFAVNAAKMGMSPEELHNQYAVRFASDLQQGYDQSGRMEPAASNGRADGSDSVISGGNLSLLHGSTSDTLTKEGVQIFRQGQKQGKKGKSFGGLYLSSMKDSAHADTYSRMGDGIPTVYSVSIKEGTKVLNKDGDITRLSEEYIKELVGQGYGLVIGKDPRGRTEYAVIDKNAILNFEAKQGYDQSGNLQTDTPAFKNWFGQSKVVDADGKPLAVYHGTSANFDVFSGRPAWKALFKEDIGTNYFTSDKEMAKGYSGGSEPMAVFLNIKNPYIYDANGSSYVGANFEALIKAKTEGHDGVIIKNVNDTSAGQDERLVDTYIVFDPAQIKSATGNNGNFDPNDANIYNQFAGVQAWSANTHSLTSAVERIKKGENPEQVRKETGWHIGADGMWRFEISDDKAQFNTPYNDWTSDRIREEVQVYPNIEGKEGTYKAIFREGTPDHFGAFGRSEEEAVNNVVRNVRKKRFADEGFDISKVSDGDAHVLSHVLKHPELFDAYPSLLNTRVHFEENTHAYRGKLDPNTDVITLAITGDEQQMLSTLLHEIQHAIQEKEGFGKGGNSDKQFTYAVKTALKELSNQQQRKIAEWTNANFDKIVDYNVAAKIARYGLLYESAQRLIGYANRSEPSGVFRLIRQEMQWFYADEFRENDRAQDLQRDFYNIPKPHKKSERNAFIGDMAFRAGRVLLNEIGPMYQGMFKNDPRTLKGMLKALEREADKKRQALSPLHDLQKQALTTENVSRAHALSTPFDVYQSLAGEVEARNTQARQAMTPEERRNTSPKQTADVPVDKIIVRFGGLEIQAPMASIAERATFDQGATVNRGSFNPTNLTISLLKNADLSTFLHETGHFFLEMQMDLAARLEQEAGLFGIENLKPGEQQIIKDANAILNWFGVQDLDNWHRMTLDEKRGFHEQFARGFEAYLFEGNAPSIELQPLFQRFKEWLKRVYKSIEALNVDLTDEVRGVFDRMIASEEQIQLAEQARSMMPLFATLDAAPMTADEFREYQNQQQEATATAVDELDARGLRDMKWLRNARSKVLKAMQKDAKEKRREVRAEARVEVMSQPVYRAWALLTAKINPEDRVPKQTVTKSNPNVVTPEIDSLFTAVAKLGGLNKADLMSQWDLDPAYKQYSGVFGKPVWRKEGGLTIDGMMEALIPYGYLTLDEHGKPVDSREFEEIFDRELRGEPQYSFEHDYNRDQEQRAGSHIANPYALNAVRFDKGELISAGLSDEIINKLAGYKMIAKTDGVHQDIIADLILDENGNPEFTSGDDLIQQLEATTPPNEEIEALTDLRMLEKYGDLSSPEAIEKAADKAIHNDVRARLVATEANALAKATGGRKILASAAKMLAATTIGRKKIRDLLPSVFTNAEVKAAKSAEKYMRAKDLANAAAEKRNQLFNMYAAKAAMEARDEVEKGLRYLKKFNGVIKGIDVDYADQIAAILSRFDLRKISNKEVDRRKSLAAWLVTQEDEGFVPDLPEHVTNEAFVKSYKELTVEEFRGVLDSVRQIEHLGRLKKKLLLAKDQREFEAIRDEIVQSINDNSQGRIANTRTINTSVEQAKKKWNAFAWGHAKVATLVKVLDGGEIGGPVWEFLVRPANERGDWETTQRAEATLALSEILAPVFKLGKMGGKGEKFPGIDRSFNREARIAIALNVGNEGNLQRLLGGEGWSLPQIAPILQSLTRDEWLAVQAIWDHFETYRPLIAAKERRVYGKEPNWVEPTPFNMTTADGETVSLRGGYYPIKYDPAASQRAEEHSDAEAAKRQLQGAYTSATTRRSFTKARAEEVKGRPLLYSLTGVYSGVNDVIHDLAWHEWLIDTNRLIKNNAIDTAIRQHYGPEFKNQFKTWTSAIAEGEKGSDNTVDIALSKIRQGVSVSGLGFNVMSAAMQPTGFTQSVSVVGAKWIGVGVNRYLANMSRSTRITNEMSEFMANRTRTRFRELNELRNSVEDQSPYKEWLGRYAYFLMMRCQQMVDVPTWIGAYEKAQASGEIEERAIALADQAVIDSQGSGMLKDLSAIERGGAAQKLFTVFYSYMNTVLNIGIGKTMSAEIGKRKAKLAADYLLLYVLPPVLGFAIKEALTPTGDDDDDYWEKLPKRLAANQIDYLMGLMVIVREFSEAAKLMAGVEDHKQDYQGPAGVRMIADTVKFGEQLGQGEFDTPFRKAFVNLMGDAFALPSAQINRTVTGIEAISEGKTSNPAAIAFGFKK